jgi:uncharacterized protein
VTRTPPFQALYLPGAAPAGGQRFALFHPPVGTCHGQLLFLHAFAEEMNKSRRMVGLAAKAMAAQGFAVLQIDFLGCGDSSGELADASWADWVADGVSGAQWLLERYNAPLWLWGERAGCLLATQVATALSRPCHFLFWQAQTQGKLVLQQFLRLKMASQMQQGQQGASKGVTEALLAELAAGRHVDVAGYRLGPELTQGLAAATLAPPPLQAKQRLLWLELSSREPASLLPASQAALGQWQAAGYAVASAAVAGPPFWQTSEIEDAPAMVQASLSSLREHLLDSGVSSVPQAAADLSAKLPA